MGSSQCDPRCENCGCLHCQCRSPLEPERKQKPPAVGPKAFHLPQSMMVALAIPPGPLSSTPALHIHGGGSFTAAAGRGALLALREAIDHALLDPAYAPPEARPQD